MRAASSSAKASITTAKAPASATALRIGLVRRPLRAEAAARLEAADRVDGLRRHADMAHHRDAAVGEIADGLGHMHAALELDGAAARLLHHACGVAEGDRRALLVGAERHVDHDQRAGRAAHHGLRMHDHELERHRHGGLVAMHHHAEGVADQQEIDMRIDDARGMSMIGGQRHDRRAALCGLRISGAVIRLTVKSCDTSQSSSNSQRPRVLGPLVLSQKYRTLLQCKKWAATLRHFSLRERRRADQERMEPDQEHDIEHGRRAPRRRHR